MSEENLKKYFPNLRQSYFKITSPQTPDYNCIAWAADDTTRFWWPRKYYWPPEAPAEETIEAFMAAYGLLGYVKCNNADYEDGYEKIAIYCLNGIPTHAARQLESGSWTSKLGNLEDIEHEKLDCLDGRDYGSAMVYMKRKKS